MVMTSYFPTMSRGLLGKQMLRDFVLYAAVMAISSMTTGLSVCMAAGRDDKLLIVPQDESEEESEPTGTPGHRGVAPWLADAARGGGKSAGPAVAAEQAPAAHSADPDEPPAGAADAQEQADAAESSAREEPALSSLQTLDEPQRLDITDMPHPQPDSIDTEVS